MKYKGEYNSNGQMVLVQKLAQALSAVFVQLIGMLSAVHSLVI